MLVHNIHLLVTVLFERFFAVVVTAGSLKILKLFS